MAPILCPPDRIHDRNDKTILQLASVCDDILQEMPGAFTEPQYQRALLSHLYNLGVHATIESPVPVYWLNTSIGQGRADIIMGRNVVIELKVKSKCPTDHEQQVTNYIDEKNRILFGRPSRGYEVTRKYSGQVPDDCLATVAPTAGQVESPDVARRAFWGIIVNYNIKKGVTEVFAAGYHEQPLVYDRETKSMREWTPEATLTEARSRLVRTQPTAGGARGRVEATPATAGGKRKRLAAKSATSESWEIPREWVPGAKEEIPVAARNMLDAKIRQPGRGGGRATVMEVRQAARDKSIWFLLESTAGTRAFFPYEKVRALMRSAACGETDGSDGDEAWDENALPQRRCQTQHSENDSDGSVIVLSDSELAEDGRSSKYFCPSNRLQQRQQAPPRILLNREERERNRMVQKLREFIECSLDEVRPASLAPTPTPATKYLTYENILTAFEVVTGYTVDQSKERAFWEVLDETLERRTVHRQVGGGSRPEIIFTGKAGNPGGGLVFVE